MANLEGQVAAGVTNGISTGIGKIISALADMIVQGITDWRFWFVMLCTWAVVHYLKGFWDHVVPRSKRHRMSEGVSAITAFLLALWVSAEDPNQWYYAVAAGLLNPFVYKFVVGIIKKHRPEWIEWLRSRDYHVEEHDGRLFAVRDDGEKVRAISPEEAKEYEDGYSH